MYFPLDILDREGDSSLRGFKLFNILILLFLSISFVFFAGVGANNQMWSEYWIYINKFLGAQVYSAEENEGKFINGYAFGGSLEKGYAFDQSGVPVIKADITLINDIVYISQYIKYPQLQNNFMINIPSANYADTKIKSVSSEYNILNFSITNPSVLNLNLENEGDLIRLDYSVKLRNSGSILSLSDSRILLTNMLMTPVVFRGQTPITAIKSEIGDPVSYGIHDYDITIDVDSKFNVFAVGKMYSEVEGSRKKERFQIKNSRDFPIAVFSKNVGTVEKDIHGTKVIFVNGSEMTEPFVEYAMSFAEEYIGEYPYKEFFVVKTDFNRKGMEHSGMILLNDSIFSDVNYAKSLTYHEVFHQWFYGVIGSDQVSQPYLDEGMVTFLTNHLMNYKTQQNTEKNFMLDLSQYGSQSRYYDLAYNSSAAYISFHYERLGEEKFFAVLKRIYDEKRFQIIYYDEFERYFY